MDEQLKPLLEGINALKNSQEEVKNELKEKMEKGQEEATERMKKGQQEMQKGQEELRNTLEKKIDSMEEKITLKVEEKIAVINEKIEKKVGEEIERIKEQVEERIKEQVEERIEGVAENFKPVLASPVPVTAFTGPVKLSAYDGKTNWEVYKTQFSIISEANGWTEGVKACQLAAFLRGEGAEVLQTLPDTERLNLNSLYDALDLRYGRKYSKEYARLKMKTRLQKTGESLQEYAFEIQRLTTLAFSEFSTNVREMI
ncbi:uncharacterized protein TNCV_2481161 [Trichonephila clavipes]|nr:uncharacterized protein TNCV_2481161 [Trichonephila clavipes]